MLNMKKSLTNMFQGSILRTDTGMRSSPASKKGTLIMSDNRIIRPMGKAFRFYAVLALAIVIFQGIGLLMYLVNVWPTVRVAGPSGEPITPMMTFLLGGAVIMGFVRSFLWIRIYWDGSKVFGLLGSEEESTEIDGQLTPLLARLTGLLVTSFVLDVLFLPAYFLSDVFLPFPLAGWRLGAVELARVFFPQAFGVAALVLAFLAHQYGRLVQDRNRMRSELELTI